ncbi:MAG: SPASM domain-containing protein [Eubacteriales bacterium]|nr:SPASM domain-containing protein [Eubacteriales bacterium]
MNKNLDLFFREIKSWKLAPGLHAVHVTNANNFDGSDALDNFYYETAEEYSLAYGRVQDAFTRAGYDFPRNYTKTVGCEFECTNTFLLDTDLKAYFCTACEPNDFYYQGRINKESQLELNENYSKRMELNIFSDAECLSCKVLPMCMGGCTYMRVKGKKFCIPEKFILDDYILRLYSEAVKN